MVHGVYCITNTINNKKYFGISFNIHQRVSIHFGGSGSRLLKSLHSSILLDKEK